MDEATPVFDPPEGRRGAVCGEHAPYGFGPPGFPPKAQGSGTPLQPAEAWYCGSHRHEGERA